MTHNWVAEITFSAAGLPDVAAGYAEELLQTADLQGVTIDALSMQVRVYAAPRGRRIALPETYAWVESLIGQTFDADLAASTSPRDGYLSGVQSYKLTAVTSDEMPARSGRVRTAAEAAMAVARQACGADSVRHAA